MKKIVLIECCNFIDFPIGGQLTFAKNMIASFNDELVLVGVTTNKNEVGIWKKTTIDGKIYDFFPYLCLQKDSKRPFIPVRLKNYYALRKYRGAIDNLGFKNVITQSPDTLLAIQNFKFENTCYRFAGTENPLSISRYKFIKYFAFFYDKCVLPIISKTNVILATADNQAIEELIIRSDNCLKKEKIYQFPTRVDSKVFNKKDKFFSRQELNIPEKKIVIITTGRLNWFKGWKFMIDSYLIFKNNFPNSHFYFIGNGEDYDIIKLYINKLNLNKNISLIGYQKPQVIAQYLNASDLFIMGSYKEGWSTSLLEALMCGIPLCVTNFSSAKAIVQDGVNGYVTESHNENNFSNLMIKSLRINSDMLPKPEDVEKYSIINLRRDILKLWKLI